MSKHDRTVLEELVDSHVSTFDEIYHPYIERNANESGYGAALARMSALLLASMKVASRDHEEFQDYYTEFMSCLHGYNVVIELNETLDESESAKLDYIISQMLALGSLYGKLTTLALRKADILIASDARRSQDKRTEMAAKARRELGEPTRQKARALMRSRPHLTWTACASAIAGGRDQSGVARVIEELFPKNPDGKRRYVGDNPADSQG